MSKFLKDLITHDLKERLAGVNEALLVNVIGLDANQTVFLRQQLREKNIRLLVVKNSLARRATEGTPLAPALHGAEGCLAVMWGGDDIVALAKEAARLSQSEQFQLFQPRGGVLDGEPLTPDRVVQISQWPSRAEQLSILVGQILSPGRSLLGAIRGPGAVLAGQLKHKAEGEPTTQPEA
jgi:ribosomal protein L10